MAASATPVLSARALTKSFGQTPALRGIDLDVHRGEILAIMGPSGSGKSTLLHCLAGVVPPDTGSVGYAGADLAGLNEEERAAIRLAHFGFVFQFGQLLPELSARDNVVVPLLLGGMPRRVARRLADDWLERLGLAEQRERLPAELSGGQEQRVAIARALAPSPDVLFADEPTGSLDSLAAEHTMSMLSSTVRSSGTTLVVITHDPRTAAFADREVIVRDGRITVPARGVHA